MFCFSLLLEFDYGTLKKTLGEIMAFNEQDAKNMVKEKTNEVILIKDKMTILQKQVRATQKELMIAETTLKVWQEIESKF